MQDTHTGTSRAGWWWFASAMGIGAVLLARFGVLAHAYRPGQGKDPGDGCRMGSCLPSSVAEQAAHAPWVRQFFFSADRSAELVRMAPDARLAEMQWLLPAGLGLLFLGLAGLLVLALRPGSNTMVFGFVAGAKIGRLQNAGWAVALGGIWTLAPTIGLYIALGYREAALGYTGCLLFGALSLALSVESRPPGFGTVWAMRVLALNLAAAALASALIAPAGLRLVPVLAVLFAFPPFMATIPVFLLAGAIAWKCRARATARLLADAGEGPVPARPGRS